MRKRTLMLLLVSAAVFAALLTACSREGEKSAMKSFEIQSDRDATSSPSALVRLQEAPAFREDERKRPYAALSDREEKRPAGDKPMQIEEPKSRK